MRVLKWLLIVMTLFGWFLTSFAQIEKGITSVGIFCGAEKTIGGDRDDSTIGPWFGLHLGYTLTTRFDLEMISGMGWNRPRSTAGSWITKWFATRPGTPYRTFLFPVIANIKYKFYQNFRIKPYVAIGGGLLFWQINDVTSGDNFLPLPPSGQKVNGTYTNLLGNVGMGFEYFLSDNLGLDVSGHFQKIFSQKEDMSGYGDINTGNIEFRIGLNFHFGGWKDWDEDGIEDKMDENPLQAEDFDGFEDDDGIPDLDNDGDGIPDVEDKAPNKTGNLDSFLVDKDKTPDLPGDLEGFPDNKTGIFLLDNNPLTYNHVHFGSNSSELTENARDILEIICRTLFENQEIRIEIRGFSDNSGTAKFNTLLALNRAKNVKKYFSSKGIDSDRMQVYSFGEEKPIAPNFTEEDRAKNRRIEIILIK